MNTRTMRTVMLLCGIGIAGCADDAPEGDLVGGGEITGEARPLPQSTADTVGERTLVTVSGVIERPDSYLGQSLTSEVRVTAVPTERGFWIDEDGERLFVVIIDQPQEEPVEVRPNTTVRLERATVRDPSSLGDLPGEPLDPDTQSILQTQDAFLVVDESNIEMVGVKP